MGNQHLSTCAKCPTPEFQYAPLKDYRYIRVLQLLPGLKEEPIRCRIVEVAPDDGMGYEALSYSWGDPRNQTNILCDEKVIRVTVNLHAALLSLRKEDTIRNVWVDAVCIHQHNLDEKASQVRKMKEIYARANNVVIWLGDAADNSDAIMDIIAGLDPEIANHVQLQLPGWDTSTHPGRPQTALQKAHFGLPEVSPFWDAEQKAIKNFFFRPWFIRAWVQQEAASNTNTVVACGSRTCLWSELFAFAWSCFYHATVVHRRPIEPQVADAVNQVMVIQRIRLGHFGDAKPLALSNLLRNSFRTLCARPHDKIYTLTGLVDPKEMDAYLPIPDYRSSPQQLFIDVVIRMLEDGISNVELNAGLQFQNLRGLPSWVPDWTSSHRPPRYTETALEGRDGRVQRRGEGGYVYITTAALSERLCFLSEMCDRETLSKTRYSRSACQEVLRLLHSCVQAITNSTIYGDQRIMALLHTFHAREPNVSGLEIIDEQQASRALHSLLDWLSEEAVAKRNETAHYHKFVNMLDRRRVFWELRFGVTEAGRFCVVPSQCQLTDYITVISGVRRPVVVRPKDGFHQLIGECYAYGIMDDQNDPHLSYSSYIADCSRKKRCSDGDYSQEDTSTALPPGWTPGALEQGRQIFEHGGLGIRTTHDPRFPHLGTGPCPKGWHAGRCAWGGKTTVPLGRRVYFINEDTGETTWDDPCLVDEPAHFPGIRLL